jgi:hypothetical protein
VLGDQGDLILHRIEQAGEVHVDHLVSVLEAQVRDAFKIAAHAGVVDTVMQGAELRDGVTDGFPDSGHDIVELVLAPTKYRDRDAPFG